MNGEQPAQVNKLFALSFDAETTRQHKIDEFSRIYVKEVRPHGKYEWYFSRYSYGRVFKFAKSMYAKYVYDQGSLATGELSVILAKMYDARRPPTEAAFLSFMRQYQANKKNEG